MVQKLRTKRLGVQPKSRPSEVINQEYNAHAVQLGHKMRLMGELEEEIQNHVEAMRALCQEVKKLPTPATQPTVTPKETPNPSSEVQS